MHENARELKTHELETKKWSWNTEADAAGDQWSTNANWKTPKRYNIEHINGHLENRKRQQQPQQQQQQQQQQLR